MFHLASIGPERRELIGDTNLKPQTGALRAPFHRDQAGVDECGDIDDLLVQLQLAGLDLGEIRDALNKVWEMPPGCIDIDRIFHAFWISDGFEHPVPNDSREPDDAVQRAAPLVALGGEKLVLGSVRDLGLFFRLAPIVLDALTLDDLPLEPFVGGLEQGVGPLRLPEGAG